LGARAERFGTVLGSGKRHVAVFASALLLAILAAASAVAVTGDLTPQGCISDVGDPAGCGTTQQGLRNAEDVEVSPDGTSVYVASGVDDAIARFDRNPATGALAPQGCISDVGDPAGCGTTQQGLDAAFAVAVSPDGTSVYVPSRGDSAIARFDRNPATGALSGQGCISDVGDPAGCGTTEQGLESARGVVVSPDGASVYVASPIDDAIVRFDRNPATGALSGQGCISDVGDPAGCGTTQQGLDGATGVAVSPDGASVYVTSDTDDAIVRFDRNPATGALSGQGCISDVGDPAGCGTTQQGLDRVEEVAVSPEGASVYAAATFDDAIVRFDRNPATGALTPRGCISDVGDAAGCGTTQQGLDFATDVVVSPDGASVYSHSFGDDAIVRFDRNPATGALGGQGCISDVGDLAGCGTTQQGLDAGTGVAVSPDGASIYAASAGDSAIARFDREPDTSISLAVTAKRKQKVKKLEVKVGCGSEFCEAELRGKAVAKKKRGGKRRRGSTAGKKGKKRFKVKPRTFSVPAGGKKTQRVKFKRNRKTVGKLRRLLKRKAYRKGTKAKLKITATDLAGNIASERVNVKLRR
jgi:DNA-binding beta-propeller fold protein YncE